MRKLGLKAVAIAAAGALSTLLLTLCRAGGFGTWVAFSDGLFVTSVAMLSIFGITWLSSCGAFDVFGYSFYALKSLFGVERRSGYAEYKSAKRRRRAPRALLVSGFLYLIMAIVCSAVVYV